MPRPTRSKRKSLDKVVDSTSSEGEASEHESSSHEESASDEDDSEDYLDEDEKVVAKKSRGAKAVARTPKKTPNTKKGSPATTKRKTPPARTGPTASAPESGASRTKSPVMTDSMGDDENDETDAGGDEAKPAASPEAATPKESTAWDLVVPPAMMALGSEATGNAASSGPGECNLLIQLDPEDAAHLDYEGISGAIGRFEAGSQGIVLDLKGRQYQGSILPGPTALLAGLYKGGQLRLEGMTDEFATVIQTHDTMSKMDAIVTGAALDEGYRVVDENVNRSNGAAQKEAEAGKNKGGAGRGRKTGSGASEPSGGGKRAASKTPSKATARTPSKATAKTPSSAKSTSASKRRRVSTTPKAKN